MTSQQTPLLGGAAVAGYPIAVLHIASRYPLVPGNAQHAQSYDFPVLYICVDIDDPHALMKGDPSIAPLVLEACEKAASAGARAVVGACGSFAYFQKEVSQQASIPVFLSIMTQVPFLLQSLGSKTLGVIAAKASAINARLFKACDITTPERLAITDMASSGEFQTMLRQSAPMNTARLEEEACAVATALVSQHPDIGALVLQCSDLPPFAASIQTATNLPVFDVISLAKMAYHASFQPHYSGYRRIA